MTVGVVVDKCCASRPTASTDAGAVSHIGKGTVTVIAVKNVLAVISDVEVGMAIIVIIGHRYPHSVGVSLDGRFGRDIDKSAVAVVPE